MATPTKYYPPLSNIVTFEQIPNGLGFIRDGLEDIFEELFYDNLYVSKNDNGNAAFYSLDVISPNKIALEIPGSGISLVLNPNIADSDISSFPITVSWQWEILAYLSDFNSETFSYSVEDFFRLGTKILGVSEESAIELAVRAFVVPQGLSVNRIEQFVIDINAFFGIAIPVPVPSENQYIELISSIEQAGVESSFIAIFSLYISNVDVSVTKEKLNYFFSSFLPSDYETYISELLIPKARATVSLSIGLEFPKNILTPVTEQGVDIPDTKSTFIFPKADFHVDTQAGIGYESEFSGSLQPAFASIAKTGLIIQIESLKVDFSKTNNIAEANIDGRPVEFIGVYARALAVTLPPKWFREVQGQTSSTLRIGAYNLLIGTGGFSGTIMLETVPIINNGQITDYYFNDFSLAYPLSAFEKNSASNIIELKIIESDVELLTLLNSNLATGFTTTFNFPTSLTTTASEQKTFENIVEYQTYLSSLSNNNVFWKSLGENGFKVGFSSFDIAFQQNNIISSNIEGRLIIPNFKDTIGNDAEVSVTGHLYEDGDFSLTAAVEAGIAIGLGNNGSVFNIVIKSLSIGRDDDKVYLEITGDLDFSNNQLLNQFLTKPIEVKKLRIYSDGSFEIEGGSIPIPGSVNMNLGPVEVNITNITLGAEKLDNGDYKFIGFDCGLSTGSGGLDLRGDGIKLYFNHDGSDMFLRIAGIGINLIIPGTASEKTAALILKGYLSIKEEEYTGAVSFKLPKANISGGAVMKMKPKIPAFAVDAFLELSAPIPLGPTGLGIFGFRGMFGLNYIADLPAGATSEPDEMFNFYTKKVGNPLNGNNPEKGLHLGKIKSAEKDSDSPISIGAGLSLGTSADAGRAFSMQAFLFLSLPEFFMISGKGNVLSERVGIVSENEPPFFAYMAITSEFISVGMGADYFIPDEPGESENKGEFLDLNADAKMAFFFDDASAWYVHFGTKEEPNQAKVLKKIFQLDAYAYLMLSVSGIETGAGIKFEMKKKYGPVKVEASAYGDVNAMISFRKSQVGGGIACGGTIGASAFGVGFDFILDAYLMMTVPKPFIVKGGLEICMKVNLWLKTWKKCVDINFKWEFEPDNDLVEIKIIDDVPFPVSAYHIGSKTTYDLSYFNNTLPNPANNSLETIPLDTFIDIQLKKPVNPTAVEDKINRLALQHSNDFEFVPPREVEKQVKHQFIIDDINIKVWNQNNNSWQNYNPYEALDFNAYLENIDPSELRIGSWQIKGRQHNTLRILADSPFSYADNMTGNFTPEQMGITATSLFCPAKEISDHCIRWEKSQKYLKGKWYSYQSITFNVNPFDAEVVPFPNVYGIPLSLSFNNHSKLEIILPEKCLRASIKLFSFANALNVSFYDLQDKTITSNDMQTNIAEYVLIDEVVLDFIDFLAPVIYEDEMQTIKKIVIKPIKVKNAEKLELLNELDRLSSLQLEGIKNLVGPIKKIKIQLASQEAQICGTKGISREIKALITKLRKELKTLNLRIKKLKSELDKNCKRKFELKSLLGKLRKEKLSHTTDKEGSELNDIGIIEEFEKLTDSLRKVEEKNKILYEKELLKVESKIKKDFNVAGKHCDKLRRKHRKKIAELKQKEEQLDRLKKLVNINWDARTNKCSTYLHEVCYLTQTEWWYNISIPSQAEVEENYDTFNNAVSKVIAPIWRPDETFAIEIKTNEVIDNISNLKDHYFAFKTAGPIGHFPLKHLPTEIKKQYGLKANGTLENNATSFAKKVEIPENALKFYLDYDKSYPNPIGNIINQKPLFYKNPKLLIAYTDPFVYHFFNNWPNYNALGKRFSTMEIEIKDPAENLSQPAEIPSLILVKPLPLLSWKLDLNPLVVESLDVINRLRNPKIKNVDFNGQTCWQIGGDPIVPASKNTEIEIKHLKPSKLYTAIISSSYSKNNDNNKVSVPVHNYPFQTSRYANLEEQINSYHLKDIDSETGSVITKDAIFKIKYDLNQLGITLNQLRDVVSQSDVSAGFNLQLIQNFPDTFQRLMLGYLKQDPLHTALNTEINLLCDGDDNLIGLWVRNPEPFNDPRIPYVNMQSTVSLIINGVNSLPTTPLFSKDNSEFLIFHNGLGQVLNSLKLSFVYLIWNGTSYIQDQSFTTENLIQS